jgi:DNA-binding PadR family transcriptional regulator
MGVLGETKRRILQELGREPAHGYALADRLKISLSAMYPHLKELRENGFLRAEHIGRRKVYRLTEKGKLLLKALA